MLTKSEDSQDPGKKGGMLSKPNGNMPQQSDRPTQIGLPKKTNVDGTQQMMGGGNWIIIVDIYR